MWRSNVAGTAHGLMLVLVSLPALAEVFYSVIAEQGRQNWLLGTLHSSDQRVTDVPPVLDQALINGERFAIESIPDARSRAP